MAGFSVWEEAFRQHWSSENGNLTKESVGQWGSLKSCEELESTTDVEYRVRNGITALVGMWPFGISSHPTLTN